MGVGGGGQVLVVGVTVKVAVSLKRVTLMRIAVAQSIKSISAREILLK